MRTMRLSILAGSLFGLLFLSDPAQAQSPDAILKMCVRDGKNAVRRMKSNVETGASSLESLEKNCIQGPKADKIKDLDGYAEVLALHKEAQALLKGAVKQIEETQTKATQAALAAGPGGDQRAMAQRYSARPRRCMDAAAWDQATGQAKDSAPRSARIKGLDDEEPAQGINPRVFAGKGSAGRWPDGMRGWDHLVRIACGKAVEGIDPFFSPNREIYGTQFLEGDSRTTLAQAINDGSEDADHKTLYKAALIQEAYGATEWDVKKDYETYLYISDAVGAPPSEVDVSAAMDKLLPSFQYEKDNLIFAFRRGAKAMIEIAAAFDKMESRYPRMKAVYRDSALQGRKRWQERRERYAAAYRVLDPITARLMDDPASKPPADCAAKLLGLRAELAREIKPKDAAGVERLRIGHPLGYQITEALAYCYLGQGQFAKAKLEADSLRSKNRRLSLGEEIFYSRQDAITALEQELGNKDKIRKVAPNYREYGAGLPVPASARRSPRFYAAIDAKGDFRTRGKEAREPAVLASMKKVAAGVQLVFKKYTTVHKYRDFQCKETNMVDHYVYEFDGGGRTIVKPVYQRNCWPVGPVKKQPVTYQEKPVIVPEADAKPLKTGMQLTVLDNLKKDGDAAIIDCWSPKTPDSFIVSQGVKLP